MWVVVGAEEVKELEGLWEWVFVLSEWDGSVACNGAEEESEGVSEVLDGPSSVDEFGDGRGGSAECGGDPLGLVGVGSEGVKEGGGDLCIWMSEIFVAQKGETLEHTHTLTHKEKERDLTNTHKERETLEHTHTHTRTEEREREKKTYVSNGCVGWDEEDGVVACGADELWLDEESIVSNDKDRVFGFELLFEREGGVVVGGEGEGSFEAGRGLSDLGTRISTLRHSFHTQRRSKTHRKETRTQTLKDTSKRDSRGGERRFHERRIRHCGRYGGEVDSRRLG